MPLLPYCMIEDEQVISISERGVQAATVETSSTAGLRAFYSSLASLAPEPATLKQSALEFHRVVSSLFEQTTVLPFRFPTLLVDVDELASHLATNAGEYLHTLRRLRGMVQMEVRISSSAVEPSRASGTQYLRDRQGRQVALRNTALEIRSQTQGLLTDWRERETKKGWQCYALIGKSSVNNFAEMVRCLKAPDSMQFRVSGPWPPTEFINQPKP